MQHQCPYCVKRYTLKTEYDKHIKACEFFRKKMSERRRIHEEIEEEIPTQQEMYRAMKDLIQECHTLREEVAHLKSIVYVRLKKNYIQILHAEPPPTTTFETWYNDIQITLTHLEHLFLYNLIEAIQFSMEETTPKTHPPIKIFKEKSNNIYIYSKYEFVSQENNKFTEIPTPKWRIATNQDIDKFISIVKSKYEIAFVMWKMENKDIFRNNERELDRVTQYSIKVSGTKINAERKLAEMKKWMALKFTASS
jgi:hypothetical protein